MADAFPIGGQIDPKGFPFLLMELHRNGATGSLKVDGPSYQKALYFRSGRILFGSSNDPRDQLGSILIESGKITPEQLEDVNAKVGPGNPLAKVLADTGFVNQRELSEAARAKVERILSDVIAYTSGSFEFEDGVLPKGAVDLKLLTIPLVLAAVRRLSDRAFVLRHIDSMDMVMSPTTELANALPEIGGEASGLPERLDGIVTLREAAQQAGLEEFDAAKLVCALLFLGLVERPLRGDAIAAPILAGSETGEPAFSFDADAPTPLELGAVAFSLEAPPTFDRVEPAATPAFEEPPLPAPVREAETTDAEPEGQEAAVPVFAAEEEEPARIAEPVGVPSRRGEPTPSTAWSVTAPHAPALDERQTDALAAPRPSKEDLAALDVLLNSRATPEDAPAAARSSKQQQWAPQFGQKPEVTRGGRRSPPPTSRNVMIGSIAAVVVAAAVGAWFLLSEPRPGETPPPTIAAQQTPAPSAPPPAQSPAVAVPGASAAPAATPSGVAAPLSPAPNTGRGAAGESRELLQQGNYPAAALGFAQSLQRAPRGTSSVQLLVACSQETVQKAVQAVSSPELFIVPVTLKGKSCYRMCWGVYQDAGRANSAVASIPAYFRDGGATPRIMSAAELLP